MYGRYLGQSSVNVRFIIRISFNLSMLQLSAILSIPLIPYVRMMYVQSGSVLIALVKS